MKKHALISVYNKTGIVEFAKELVALGWEILSSGGTAGVLSKADVSVMDIGAMVGEPILGHRVVTLSRKIHSALLARPAEADRAELEKLNFPWIDMVINDMYPLQAEIAKPDSTPESVIENTDIGGPTMIRSAAKGRRIVVCDPADRQRVIEWLKAGEPDREAFVTALAAKAEAVVADYCLMSAIYHGQGRYYGLVGKQVFPCKYGENGYQTPAALYGLGTDDPLALDKFKVISGTDPSFNNVCDIDRLIQTITHIAAAFDVNRSKVPLIAVSVKHGNPCGAAFGADPLEVIHKMVIGDMLAIFGGFLMLNFQVTEEVAEKILTDGMPDGKRRLLDGIIAPGFDDGTVDMLKRKGDKCRLIVNSELASLDRTSLDTATRFRCVRGGFLAQPNYTYILDFSDPDLKKYGQASPEQEDNMLLASAICCTSNSNTITIVRNGMLIGNGVGQQARVYGARLAIARAEACNHRIHGAAAASDSFFPETDGIEALANAGVTVVFSTSGSVRDEEVIRYCDEKDIILYLIPDKKGRGFFGH